MQERVILRNPGRVKHVGVVSLSAEYRLILKFYAEVGTVPINKSRECTSTSNALVRDVLKTKLRWVFFKMGCLYSGYSFVV